MNRPQMPLKDYTVWINGERHNGVMASNEGEACFEVLKTFTEMPPINSVISAQEFSAEYHTPVVSFNLRDFMGGDNE